MTARNRASAGFTLIEMLVSLAVMGLLAGLLGAGLGSASILSQRAKATEASLDRVAAVQRLIRDRVERLSAVVRLDSADPIVDARGDAAEFRFFAPAAGGALDAVRRYRLLREPSGALVLYSASALDDRVNLDAASLIGWDRTVLIDGVAEMTLGYFGTDPNTGGRRWQSFWQQQSQPPDLVRIRLRLAGPHAPAWPDLIVRPRATSNTACRIDSFTGRCGSS